MSHIEIFPQQLKKLNIIPAENLAQAEMIYCDCHDICCGDNIKAEWIVKMSEPIDLNERMTEILNLCQECAYGGWLTYWFEREVNVVSIVKVN